MGAMEMVEKSQLAERPAMKSGDTVRVHVKVREGDKERIQIFEGMVIRRTHGGAIFVGDGASEVCTRLVWSGAPDGVVVKVARCRSVRESSVFFRCIRRPFKRSK